MERWSVAIQKRTLAAMMICAALMMTAPFTARAGDDLSFDLRQNVVRVTAAWKNGAAYDGVGFIVGGRGGALYVVTADHVVRGEGSDAMDENPRVAFFGEQGTEYKADLLGTRLAREEGDIAILRLEAPAALAWRRDAVAAGRPRRGASIWFVGLQRDWYVPTQAGSVNKIEPSGAILADGLNVKVGTSGAPLISEAGIIGMVVVDAGSFARATPIERIERAVRDWGYPWDLTPAPAPVHECDRLAASPNDPLKPAQVAGLDAKKIDVKKAIPACVEATETYAATPRFAFQLGRIYDVKGDFGDAFLWYRRAADAGHATAQNNLGTMYSGGRKGLAKDEARAVQLYRLD